MQPALFAALLTYSKLLILITGRIPLPSKNKWRRLPPPLNSQMKHLQAAQSEPLTSVSIREKVHPGVCRKPNLPSLWNLAKQTFGESCQNLPLLLLSWPRLVLKLPSQSTLTFLPQTCLTWICHNLSSFVLIHWNAHAKKEQRKSKSKSFYCFSKAHSEPIRHRETNI